MQIEQLGQVLGKILADMLGLKSGNVSGAYEQVAETFQAELDIDLEQLICMTKDEFEEYISDCLFKTAKLYYQLAEVLTEAAEAQHENEKSLKLYEKVLILFQMEIKETKTFSLSKQRRKSEIEMIIQKLYKKI